MASGSSGRNSSGSKGFDFATDDILCSYDDYANQESSNGSHSDPVSGANSAKELHKSRLSRSSVFPASAYSPPEESNNQDVISTVERSMKKYADNLMRFLEGISSRLSQLELYCYNLDKSIGEMRLDLNRDHEEADSKLKSLEKHIQEVHRSLQILRDKQELAETQKELAKLQLAQKESSSATHTQQNEERAAPPASVPKNTDKKSETHGQQLALALPHQVAMQPSLPNRPVEQQLQPVASTPPMPPQTMTQSQAYYLLPSQLSNLPGPTQPSQPSQGQYLTSDSQYRTPPQPTQSQVNQTPQIHPSPQYQQQWPQQLSQQVQPPQQTSMQPQIRPSSTSVYPPYLPTQQTNPTLPETLPNSMPMQMPYGYGAAGRTAQPQPPPQHLKASFGTQPGEGYTAAGPHPTHSPGNAYMMYDNEGGRAQHLPQPPHFSPSGYPQNPQPNSSSNLLIRPPTQLPRNHPYYELVEKLVNMGYRSDHVVNVILRLEESGQPVDFNAVLDRLNGHSSGGSQRGWSG